MKDKFDALVNGTLIVLLIAVVYTTIEDTRAKDRLAVQVETINELLHKAKDGSK